MGEGIYTNLGNIVGQAKKIIFIYDIKRRTHDFKYNMFFDEIVPFDFDNGIEILANLVKNYINDSQKTRLITVSDISQVYVPRLR